VGSGAWRRIQRTRGRARARVGRSADIARESFVTAADVADVLALSGELDYRSAHQVVGRAVRDLVDSGDVPAELTPERVAAVAHAVIGRPLAIESAALREALDPAACASSRRQTGSSSESALDAMLVDIDETLAVHAAWSDGAREQEAIAEAALLDCARAVAASA